MPTYKHELVYADLREKILEGDYAPRDSLGSEHVLCERYDVSRSTLRAAISQLKQEGLVHSRQGSGVYVNPPELYGGTDAPAEQHTQDCDAEMRLLKVETTSAGQHAAVFGLGANAQLIHARFLQLDEGFPHAMGDSYVPRSLMAHVNIQQVPYLSLEQLEKACGYVVSHTHYRVQAIGASDEVAARLRVRAGTPLLQVDEYAFLTHGVLLRHLRQVTREKEIRFTTSR